MIYTEIIKFYCAVHGNAMVGPDCFNNGTARKAGPYQVQDTYFLPEAQEVR